MYNILYVSIGRSIPTRSHYDLDRSQTLKIEPKLNVRDVFEMETSE